MKITFLLAAGLCLAAHTGSAYKHLRPAAGLNMRHDSVAKLALIAGFDDFLGRKEGPNQENTLVLPEDLPATSLLLDELKQMEWSRERKDSSYYKCYLTNLVPFTDNQYRIQCAYLGVQGNEPVLRACFDFIATRRQDKWYFSSPLTINTRTWKRLQAGQCTCYYQHGLNQEQLNAYARQRDFYDRKLGAPPSSMTLYLCDNLPAALQAAGVAYKADYNGYGTNALSAHEHNGSLVVAGTTDGYEALFDPHDLWHARLRRVVPAASVNKAVDEGCAFLYGGSWGLSWAQIYQSFMDKLGHRPDTTWLAIYESTCDHGCNKNKPLLARYTINAFIVERLERDKGFAAVRELLTCGRYEESNTHYFDTLEKLTGINRANFNERIADLVRHYRLPQAQQLSNPKGKAR